MSRAPRRKRSTCYWLAWPAIVALGRCVYPLVAVIGQMQSGKPGDKLLIGAGPRGWELIEYQEIELSAREYLGEQRVARLVLPADEAVLPQLAKRVREMRPSHYYFDPRAGSQEPLKAIWEAVQVGLVLSWFGVTPICSLTDFPVRVWRIQCAIVSARNGVVSTLMAPRSVSYMFPHRRLIGPMPFPLSSKTLQRLTANRRARDGQSSAVSNQVVFVGALYEPRATTIELLRLELSARDIELEIVGRPLNGERISNSQYWAILQRAKIVVSTSSQVAGKHTDFDGSNHLIYKFIEVTAAGTALAIEPAEGVENFLTPDVDFISFQSVDEAVTKITSLLDSPAELKAMSNRGFQKAKHIVESQYFWSTVDSSLGNNSLTGFGANHVSKKIHR